ncbi:aspartyl/asparaginyl beta-hydroxylase domain-containing protein [Pseudomonas sp. REP124]|uniref:aspartyl/asparaginyl beta-hydroxylase domain-containing protein n=1 Tax=Pseudomonas sp. REP124 TaxID=2875731 RepID=UPI001CCDEAF0|nr:aspartyl/asparaginyl beta-hydroxylase domain-containing protein [Pseudomonas sp. REP124]MBZ9780183.1 aspartyl/asparaginyl beta-hydroxylase domain-containing protein [Pseudomonas sp. REP124]
MYSVSYCGLLFFLLYSISAWPIARSQFDMLNIVVPYSMVQRFSSYYCWLVLLSIFTFTAGLYNGNELLGFGLLVSSQLLLIFLIIWMYTMVVICCRSALKWRMPVLTLWCEAFDGLGDIDDKTRKCILDLIDSEFHGRELSRFSRLSSGLFKPTLPVPYATNININGFKSTFGPRKPIWSKDDFSFLSGIDTLLVEMKLELIQLYEKYKNIQEEYPFHGDPLWKSVPLYKGGKKVAVYAELVPNTIRFVEDVVPGATIREVVLSSLEPGGHIEPHLDYVYPMLTLHFPILCGDDGLSGLRIGEEVISWRAGEIAIIDTTFQHESWNHSESTRVNLMFDFWPGDLSLSAKAFFTEVYSQQMLRHLK